MKKQKRGSQQSPKSTSQPRRRSSRLSPQTDNKDQQSANRVAEECVLKPRCVNTANWQFTHQSKDFKVPAKNASSKLRRTSNDTTKSKDGSFKPAQVLCPLRHGPKEVCTICMARYISCSVLFCKFTFSVVISKLSHITNLPQIPSFFCHGHSDNLIIPLH